MIGAPVRRPRGRRRHVGVTVRVAEVGHPRRRRGLNVGSPWPRRTSGRGRHRGEREHRERDLHTDASAALRPEVRERRANGGTVASTPVPSVT